MLVFLYGSDSYRIKQYLEKLIGGGSALTLDLSENAGERLIELENSLKTVSIFGEKQFVVAKNGFAAADGISGLLKKRDLAADTKHVVIFWESVPEAELAKKSKKLFETLTAKPNEAKEFKPLGGKQLEDWISRETAALGGAIEEKAVKKLIEYAGNDAWRLSQELAKLVNYSQSGKITEGDVLTLVTKPPALNIFETIDALGTRNKAKTATLLAEHLANGEDPHYLFSMFIYQFRNLLRVKSLLAKYATADLVVKKTGLHPFVVKKTMDQAKRFELDELKKKFSILAESDVLIKNGQIDITDCLFQIALG